MYMNISLTIVVLSLLCLSACSKPRTTKAVTAETVPVNIKHESDNYTVSRSLTDFTDYILVKTNGGTDPQVISVQSALDDLVDYDVIFIGEVHGHVANHRLQANIFSGIYDRHNNTVLSMEQFERDEQAILDKYIAGEIGEGTLIKEGAGWKHYQQSYRPMVEFAKKHNLSVIAANAPSMAVRCVGMNGPAFLDTVKGEKRDWIASTLNLQDGLYKNKFYESIGGMLSHGAKETASEKKKAARLFKAFAGQVTRDDTMAESIYKYRQANPDSKIIHTNGSFHSAALLGTAERLSLRDNSLKLANIHPVEVENTDYPSFTQEDLKQGQYILLITTPPKQYIKKENLTAFYQRTGKTMKNRVCDY